jgi:hypothetical protein
MSSNRIMGLFPQDLPLQGSSLQRSMVALPGLSPQEPGLGLSPQRPVLWPRSVQQRLLPGSRVRVRTGAFAGVEGTVAAYCSASRLIIDLDLDVAGVTLELEDRAIELLSHDQ